MSEDLDRIPTQRRTGAERFTDGPTDLGFDLLGFWQWSASDLVENTVRGVLAEYLVAKALGVDVSGPRDGWAPYDLSTPEGVKVEVKSSAYLQSWRQTRLSTPTFRIPRTTAWDSDTDSGENGPKRQADVYVFAVLAHRDKATLNPLDLPQWDFYVLPTSLLDQRAQSQLTISLSSLGRWGASPVQYRDLARAVRNGVGGRGWEHSARRSR
jgi:hypothetical protein